MELIFTDAANKDIKYWKIQKMYTFKIEFPN